MFKNRYDQLSLDLKEAYEAAQKVKTNDDGGSANMDAAFLILKKWQERKVLKAIKNAGLYCKGKIHWICDGYLLDIGGGQGNNRTRVRNEFARMLELKGYQVLHFDKID